MSQWAEVVGGPYDGIRLSVPDSGVLIIKYAKLMTDDELAELWHGGNLPARQPAHRRIKHIFDGRFLRFAGFVD